MRTGARYLLLSLLLFAALFVESQAKTVISRPRPPLKDCCPKGKFCCGSKCQPNKLKPVIFCALSVDGCCKPDKSPCKQEPFVVGHCRAAIPRWSYNPRTKKCEQFSYGGCGGNDNNFSSKEKCEKKCDVKPDPKPDDCCRPGYFCCGSSCIKRRPGVAYRCAAPTCCKPKPPPLPKDPCDQPKDPGPCKAAFRKWYFNKRSGKCKIFIYGGCKGNDNRFDSKKDCEKKCDPKPKDCCKRGYFCCGGSCLKNGTRTFAPCGHKSCCKPKPKDCRKTGCKWPKICCKGRCRPFYSAKKLGCIRRRRKNHKKRD